MLGTPPLTSPLRVLVRRLHDWPVASQQVARRNAMVAATACAQRRIEREDVADYLAGDDADAPDAVDLTDDAPVSPPVVVLPAVADGR
ncbi:hypothetical protein GCM10023340_35950 [Nocardioides marinquilinus]|uniref:Uncharacterized protein n=1 Tax=Nocardioides marinquilinus TaxID=1210400 RepID=A0ABP9PX58_9ACTN